MADRGVGESEAFEFDGWNERPVYEMYLPDEDQIRELHAIASNVNGIREATDAKQVCVYAVGIMCCVSPKFANTLPDQVAETGFKIHTIRLPSEAKKYGINLDEIETLDTASYLALFGFTLLLLFKTVTTATFKELSQNALSAVGGVQQVKELSNPYSVEKAHCVRWILGINEFIRRRVIRMVLDMQNGNKDINNICRYVASVLEYHGMTAIMFTYEMLAVTLSPVLTDTRLGNEALNLIEALELIGQSEHPQYFRYLEDQEKVSKIEKARFPTLAAVGEKLKFDSMGDKSVKNDGAKSNMDSMVAELVAVHKRAMAKNKPVKTDALVCQPVGPRVTETDDESDDDEDETDDDDDEEDVDGEEDRMND